MTTFRHIRLWALGLLFVATCAAPATGCDPTTWKDVVWPQTVTCGTQQAGPVIDTVSTILLQDVDPADSLEELAREHGPELVACLVEQVVRGFMAQDADRMAAKYKPDPARVAAAERGRAFLASKGVEVR
jgi:hypothetical protein